MRLSPSALLPAKHGITNMPVLSTAANAVIVHKYESILSRFPRANFGL
jgi:hypothetical protein